MHIRWCSWRSYSRSRPSEWVKKYRQLSNQRPLDKPCYATCMGYLGTTTYAWDSTLQEVPKSTKFKRYLILSKCVLSSQQLKTRSWLHKLSGRPRASSYLVISLSYPAFCQYHILITYLSTLRYLHSAVSNLLIKWLALAPTLDWERKDDCKVLSIYITCYFAK